MAYFPFMVDIEDKKCLVAGGGRIAFQKVSVLAGFGVNLLVIAEKICPELQEFAGVTCCRRQFADTDIEGMDFVVAATDNPELNRRIARLCHEENIPVNAVDDKEACSFIFPALIQNEDLLVAVSTGGSSPAAAAYVKNRLKEYIPEYYGKMIAGLSRYREEILDRVPSAKNRKALFETLLRYADSHDGELPEDVVRAYLETYLE